MKKFEDSKEERELMKIADDESLKEEEREYAWMILGLIRAIESGELDFKERKK